MFQIVKYCDFLLWTVGPAAPLVEIQRVATFGAADAVVAVPPAGVTVGRTFLTQVGGSVAIGTRWTLQHAGTVLVQEVACDGAQFERGPPRGGGGTLRRKKRWNL